MACTTILVGRKASYDGSTMIARTEDSQSGVFTPKEFLVITPEDQLRHYQSVLSKFSIDLPDSPLRYTSVPDALGKDGIWGGAGINSANVAMSATETITTNADVDTKYARQSGGKGQYGHVKLHVYPNESGKGYEFINAIVGGSIPKEYIPAVDAGIQGALQSGVLAGYQTVDVKVELYDGSYHEVDSSEMAFKIAGSMAIKEACRKANPVILEPIMKVVVTVPEEYMGDVIGDLSSRRGEIQGMEDRNGVKQINAFVPLSEMFGYSNDLRSKSQGRGQYVMEPSHYIQVPKSIADGIISKRAKD